MRNPFNHAELGFDPSRRRSCCPLLTHQTRLTQRAAVAAKETAMNIRHALVGVVGAVCTAVVMLPITGSAQKGDLTHHHPAATDAAVDFGVLPTAPLGPAPCVQSPATAIGGPTDPCAYKIHHLTPEEVTIFKGGQVTFQIHGGGHAFAIYEVSKDTTRDEVGQYLCAGFDPSTIANPALHVCNLLASNANAEHVVLDGHNDVVIVAANVIPPPVTVPPTPVPHPDNRVWYEPGRLMSAGGHQFLNGGTIAAGPTSNGQLVTYRFLKNGRYLVICMNRVHFLNDWMFGFVNVVGGNGHDKD
jgi:hypothetical protein